MESASRMADAALALVEALQGFNPDALARATFPFADAERERWFYTPTDHGGLALFDMDAVCQQRTMQLVATGTSQAGYNTTAVILSLENILDHVEGFSVHWGRPRGRDPLEYYVSVFGDPSSGGPWGWRFGGHHVSLHYTVLDNEVIGVNPLFLGADPGRAPLVGPHELRPLAGCEDLGWELVRSLDADQLGLAVLSEAAPADIVVGNRSAVRDGLLPPPIWDVWRGRLDPANDELLHRAQASMEASLGLDDAALDALRFTDAPKGVAVPSLAAEQRNTLQALLHCYLDRMPADVAAVEAERVMAGFDQLHFAWAGGLDDSDPHYYRIQGPELVVEFDNTQRGANHIHSVWRDPRNDFGLDALARHYRDHHGDAQRGDAQRGDHNHDESTEGRV